MPETSTTRAPAGHRDVRAPADGLDAVALDENDAVLDHFVSAAAHRDDSAPDEGERPVGMSAAASNPIGCPFSGASGSFSGAPARNANASGSARVKSSGPSDQWRLAESPGPVQVFAGVSGDPRHGKRLRLRTDLDPLAGSDERRDERVEALAEGEPLLVRRDRELRGVVRDVVLARVRAVQSAGDEDALLVLALLAAAFGLLELHEVDAVAGGAELRARIPLATRASPCRRRAGTE